MTDQTRNGDKCPLCDDDGWVDTFDSEGDPAGAMDCPRLHEPGHAPFNSTGLLPDSFSSVRGSVL